MNETDSFRLVNPGIGIRTGIEPGLQIGIGNYVVIDSVAVFLLLLGLEKVETAGHQHRIGKHRDTIGKDDIIRFLQPVDGAYFRISEALDTIHLCKQAFQCLAGRNPVREQSVPGRKMTAKHGRPFYQYDIVPQSLKS